MKRMIDAARLALIGVGVVLSAILIGGCLGWFEETVIPCPDCPDPCEDKSPEVVAVCSYDGCALSICVDTSQSSDGDDCGIGAGIVGMEISLPSDQGFIGLGRQESLTFCFSLPVDEFGCVITEGIFLITVYDNDVYDNDKGANSVVCHYTINADGTASFAEEVPIVP